MAYELNEGQGSLFSNSYKEKPSQPDVKGTILLDGVLYELAGWVKESANGIEFTSLRGKRKETNSGGGSSAQPQGGSSADNSVPF